MSVSGSQATDVNLWRKGVEACADREWLLVLGLALAPAGLTAALGDLTRATFFFGTAQYLAILKWVGWVFLRPRTPEPLAYLRLPAELFLGAAALCGWFVIRNLVAIVAPGSFSLEELRFLFPILLIVHIGALLIRRPVGSVEAILIRIGFYAPFVAAWSVALWQVSGMAAVLGVDPMHHAYTAQKYAHQGLANSMSYPATYGILNAITISAVRLDAIQAIHLQHVLWCVTAACLIPATVAWIAQRPLRALHSVLLPVLAAFPLPALHPDIFYPGTPKQIGIPMAVASALIPLMTPLGSWKGWACWSLLLPLNAGLNPACASFAMGGTLVGMGIQVIRNQTQTQAWKSLIVQGALLGGACTLILLSDPFYSRRFMVLGTPQHVSTRLTTRTPRMIPTPPVVSSVFSWRRGMESALTTSPFTLSPPISATGTTGFDRFENWHQRPLTQTFVLVSLGLAIASLATRGLSPRSTRTVEGAAMVRFLALLLLGWLVVKYGGAFLGHGFSLQHSEGYFLNIYTRYLIPRCEILLLLACLVGAGTLLYLGRRSTHPGLPLAVGIGCWLGPGVWLALGGGLAGPAILPTNQRFAVTEGDLRLVIWANDHLPPEKGMIGLAALATRGGMANQEFHLHPLDAGHALGLRGRYGNVRFFLSSLEGEQGHGDYLDYIRDSLDAEWCRRVGIQAFYIGPDGLRANPGLAWAIAEGVLREWHRDGSGALYTWGGE